MMMMMMMMMMIMTTMMMTMKKNYRKSELRIRNTSRADAGDYVGHKEGKPANDEHPHHLDMVIDHHDGDDGEWW